jgi:hypothetical protein
MKRNLLLVFFAAFAAANLLSQSVAFAGPPQSQNGLKPDQITTASANEKAAALDSAKSVAPQDKELLNLAPATQSGSVEKK